MPVIDSPGFVHTFVPIDSLTNSPRSSTVSTSVLEWNSNSGSEPISGSEGFSVRSFDHEQYGQSSPASPHFPTLPPTPPSPKASLPDDDQTFASFNSAAPVADTVSNTVTTASDTFLYHNLLSALDERLTLQDSVTQWQNHSYRETAGLDNRPESPSDLLDDGVHDKPHNSSAPSPIRSLATDSSVSGITVKPSLHVSSLFLPPSPPAPPAPASPPSPSVVFNQTQSGGISIAQYFQLKAATVEDAEPVQPQVDGLVRPISAASCLSYTSSAQAPVAAVPLPDRSAEAPLLHQTWQDLISKVDKSSNSTTAYSPPRRPPRWSSSYSSWYQPLSRPRTSQMENNNAGPQFDPSTINIVVPPSPQGSDTLESNLKSHAPSRPVWPTPPAATCQFEPATNKPTINLCPAYYHDRPHPCITSSLHVKTPGKPTNRPVPPPSRDQSSPYPIFNCHGSDLRRPSWFAVPPRIIQASPESIDSVLPPPPSSPSVSSPTRPGSPRSPTFAIPPCPPRVELQPPYLRHPTPSNCVPYIPTPPVPPFNGAYSATQRTSRALPIPSISRTFGSHTQAPYTPRYTDSTLPRDMHLSAAPPTPWGPTPRRLRFAPLPPTPSAGLHYTGAPGPTQPYTAPLYTAPLPPYPLYPMPYPYHAQAPAPVPQTPAPISTPYSSSWRPGGPTNSSPLWTPHHVFWYSDGSIVFRIENVGYKVHRHFFERHSTYFRDLLAYPTYSVTSPVPHTIHLSDVKKVDFERLLLIFYPSSLAADGPELFTVEEWTSILTLSDKWNFAELKTNATFQLSSIMTTIEKIALSKKHNVGNPYWLLAAYRELCTRRYPLSLVEGEKLGLETVIKIWEVQHELLVGSTWGRSVDIVIKEKFGLL